MKLGLAPAELGKVKEDGKPAYPPSVAAAAAGAGKGKDGAPAADVLAGAHLGGGPERWGATRVHVHGHVRACRRECSIEHYSDLGGRGEKGEGRGWCGCRCWGGGCSKGCHATSWAGPGCRLPAA